MRKRRNGEEGGRGGQVEVGLEKRALAKPWDGPEEHGDCRALYSSAKQMSYQVAQFIDKECVQNFRHKPYCK